MVPITINCQITWKSSDTCCARACVSDSLAFRILQFENPLARHIRIPINLHIEKMKKKMCYLNYWVDGIDFVVWREKLRCFVANWQDLNHFLAGKIQPQLSCCISFHTDKAILVCRTLTNSVWQLDLFIRKLDNGRIWQCSNRHFMRKISDIHSLNFCLQRATDNLIFGSKHDRKIAMLSAWFGAFFSMIGKNCLQDKTR